MIRDEKNGIIGGVISGIANEFNMDAVALRVLVVILSMAFFETAAMIYIILWMVTPSK